MNQPRMRRALLLLVFALLVGGCSTSTSTFGQAATSTPTAQACDRAPAWLVAAIQTGITQKGAKLTNAFIVPAGPILDGPPIVLSDRFAKAQLVAGTITGGGVLDEPAVWITNATTEDQPALLYAVSAAARRYSDWGADAPTRILADGTAAALICAGS